MNIYRDLLLPTAEFLGEFSSILYNILFYEINILGGVKVISLLGWLGVGGIVAILIIRIIRG